MRPAVSVSGESAREMAASELHAAAPPAHSGAVKRKRRTPAIVAVGLLVAGTAMGFRFATRGIETTDDAQVEGHVINISSRVAGQVLSSHLEDNQLVNAGDVLFELDPADYAVKVQAARADLLAARAQAEGARATLAMMEKAAPASIRQARGSVTSATASIGAAEATIEQTRAELAAAESREALALLNLSRARELLGSSGVPPAEVDARESEFKTAHAEVAHARAKVAGALSTLEASRGDVAAAQGRLTHADTAAEQVASARATVALADARVGQAEAALKLAELNFAYTSVRAPRRGVVSKRTVEQGQMVGPERPLLAIVPLDDQWVTANFKEDQLADIRVGQRATIEIDTYSGRSFHGRVASIAASTGARLALLPPDNATGNFVKVVQRVPVLVRVDDAKDVVLRPGMSAEVSIETAH